MGRKRLIFQIHYGFSAPQKVIIHGLPTGYGNSAISTEEPFISRDGNFLFFNSHTRENNKDLHYARRADGRWQYGGALGPHINTAKEVEGNPSMDRHYNFYYVTSKTQTMIKTGKFNPRAGTIGKLRNVTGVPQRKIMPFKGKFIGNMGVEISQNGRTAYFSRATFKMALLKVGRIQASDILVSQDEGAGLVYRQQSAKRIMANINTADLEYAASISNDGLTLYFTRMKAEDLKSGNIRSAIMHATRSDTTEPFGRPRAIAAIGNANFVEGPSITADSQTLYYHQREGKKFRIYKVVRTN